MLSSALGDSGDTDAPGKRTGEAIVACRSMPNRRWRLRREVCQLAQIAPRTPFVQFSNHWNSGIIRERLASGGSHPVRSRPDPILPASAARRTCSCEACS